MTHGALLCRRGRSLGPAHGSGWLEINVQTADWMRASHERLCKVDDGLGQAWTVRAGKALAVRQRVGGLTDRGLGL